MFGEQVLWLIDVAGNNYDYIDLTLLVEDEYQINTTDILSMAQQSTKQSDKYSVIKLITGLY